MYSLALTVLTRLLLCMRAQVKAERDNALQERDNALQERDALRAKIADGLRALE